MSDKVYIVTRGSYSDYRIVAVFANEEVANEFVKRNESNGWGDPPEVEEWEFYTGDEYPIELVTRKFYTGSVEIKTVIDRGYHQDHPLHKKFVIQKPHFGEHYNCNKDFAVVVNNFDRYYVLGIDEERVRKATFDWYYKKKAEIEGLT